MKNQSKIALGTWSWGAGFAGADQGFGNIVGFRRGVWYGYFRNVALDIYKE